MVLAPSVATPATANGSALDRAILSTVVYGDVFEYPLRDAEVHRYLHGLHASEGQIHSALARASAPDGPLTHRDGYYTLRGREALVDTRRGRAARADQLWPIAVRYGHVIAGFPFVRMVAVTGSLAWDNVPHTADIDYLIVTEPGHLWKTRWMLAVLRRIARLEGVRLCPNCMVSKRALTVWDRDLYVAYELACMRPIAGRGMYRRLRRLNPWTASYLPNAQHELRPPHGHIRPSRTLSSRALAGLSGLSESLLRTRVGSALERLEMSYRIRKIMRYRSRRMLKEGIQLGEASYSPDKCMGFGGGHRRKALTMFAERLSGLGVAP